VSEITLFTLPATPIIIALVAAIGSAVPALPRRAYPLLAIGLAMAWHVALAAHAGESIAAAALCGVLTGLAASGLYSAALKPALSRDRK
jgi:hypothetical protein